MKAIMTLVLSAALIATAEKKSKPAPTTYENTRIISASCDAVWPRVVPTVARFWFAPEASDRAGGFMRLRFTRGDDLKRAADGDVKKFTTHRMGALDSFERFHVVAGVLTTVADGENCTVMLMFEYWAERPHIFSENLGPISMQSNGALESQILAALAEAVPGKPSPSPSK